MPGYICNLQRFKLQSLNELGGSTKTMPSSLYRDEGFYLKGENRSKYTIKQEV